MKATISSGKTESSLNTYRKAKNKKHLKNLDFHDLTHLCISFTLEPPAKSKYETKNNKKLLFLIKCDFDFYRVSTFLESNVYFSTTSSKLRIKQHTKPWNIKSTKTKIDRKYF